MRQHMLDCNVPVRRKQNRRLVSTQPLASEIWGMVVIKTCRAKSSRIIAPMTQARTASSGVVTPPPLQHWLHAVLMLFAELVQGVATTLGMWRRIGRRDWHTQSGASALPQAKSDIQLKKEANTTHGVILGPVPRISVGSSRGLTLTPLETHNRNSRHEAENDTVGGARPHQALILSSTQSVRPSKDERVLTSLSPLIPANAGIQGGWRTLSRLAASSPRTSQNRSWIPTFVGMNGSYCANSARL
jgi:hypothetical protein